MCKNQLLDPGLRMFTLKIRNYAINWCNTAAFLSLCKPYLLRLGLLWFFIFWAGRYCPLLGRNKSRGRCWAAIRLSQRLEPPGHAVHEEFDGLDIGGQHGRRFDLLATLTGRIGGHNPICISRRGNVQQRDPRCSCKGHSRRVGAHVRDESVVSSRVVQPLCIPLMIRPVRHT